MDAIHVHIIVGGKNKKQEVNSSTVVRNVEAAHIPKVDPSELCIKSGQITDRNFSVEMSNSPKYDRLVPHYAYHEWSSLPDQNKLNHEAIKSILYRVREYYEQCCPTAGLISQGSSLKRKNSQDYCIID